MIENKILNGIQEAIGNLNKKLKLQFDQEWRYSNLITPVDVINEWGREICRVGTLDLNCAASIFRIVIGEEGVGVEIADDEELQLLSWRFGVSTGTKAIRLAMKNESGDYNYYACYDGIALQGSQNTTSQYLSDKPLMRKGDLFGSYGTNNGADGAIEVSLIYRKRKIA